MDDLRLDVPAGPLVGRWATHPVPWGVIHIAATDRGIVAVDLRPVDEDAWVASIARRLNGNIGFIEPSDEKAPMPERQRRLLLEARRQIDQHLAGYRHEYSLDVDLRGISGWDRQVLEATRRIRWNHVTSYGRLAKSVGSPGAARAVGGALRRNPVPIIIPCHRILASDGTLGGYAGVIAEPRDLDRHAGLAEPAMPRPEDPILAIKHQLLEIEGIRLPYVFGLPAVRLNGTSGPLPEPKGMPKATAS